MSRPGGVLEDFMAIACACCPQEFSLEGEQ
jgi:hypothetical protein